MAVGKTYSPQEILNGLERAKSIQCPIDYALWLNCAYNSLDHSVFDSLTFEDIDFNLCAQGEEGLFRLVESIKRGKHEFE